MSAASFLTKLLYILCLTAFALVGCGDDNFSQTTIQNVIATTEKSTAYNPNLYATTVIGYAVPTVYTLDGNLTPRIMGTPFTQEEIQSQLDTWKSIIQSEFGTMCDISVIGYHSIFMERFFTVDYSYSEFQIYFNDEIVGNMTMYRVGNYATSSLQIGNVLSNLLDRYPDGEFVMIYGNASKAAITPDNKVHIIHGRDVYNVINGDSLYNNYKTDDNVFNLNVDRVPIIFHDME